MINKTIEKIIKRSGFEEFERGELRFVRAYITTTRRYNSELVVVDELVWEEEYEDFLNFIKTTGIQQFVVADASTGLIGLLHFLIEKGCQITGAALVEEKERNTFSQDKKALIIKVR